ncbi:hypothetical protein C5S32_12390 [ANME-1 cluster archaeon GoMg1]|nr:hypothetical protein [ANME-1 cluster archaeon GoMg1]
MGRIDEAPGWIQKYMERIDKRAIAVEDILKAENKVRVTPIKLSTVTRALNSMGYSVAELRSGETVDLAAGVKKEKQGEKIKKARIGPDWLQKYCDRIENGTITVEDVLEEENKIRPEQIKISTVTRALNSMGYLITDLRRGKEGKPIKAKAIEEGIEKVVYSSGIGKISKATEKRFADIKKSWEEHLDKSMQDDYFVNILLALAKLLEHGKTLAPA